MIALSHNNQIRIAKCKASPNQLQPSLRRMSILLLINSNLAHRRNVWLLATISESHVTVLGYFTQFFRCCVLRAMSRLNISSNPILPSVIQHHFLNLKGNCIVFEGPDIGATTLESLCIPRSSWAWTLE